MKRQKSVIFVVLSLFDLQNVVAQSLDFGVLDQLVQETTTVRNQT